ncbi:MAG: hypothetical protein SNJ79_06050, partial [Sphingomonadaceae bacterium]
MARIGGSGRRAGLLVAAAAGAMATSAHAQVQTAAAAEQGDIIVTGTLIRGSLATGALPIDVLQTDDLL